MKKILTCLAVIVFLGTDSIAGKKKVTEVEKYQAQLQALAQQRQQHVNAIAQLELEMIKVQAIIEYITKDDKKEK